MGWGANTLDIDYMNRKVTVQFFNDDTGATLLPVVVDIPADAQADWFITMLTDRVIQLDANSRAMVGIAKGFVTLDEAKLSKIGIAVAKDPAKIDVEIPVVLPTPAPAPAPVVTPPIGGVLGQ